MPFFKNPSKFSGSSSGGSDDTVSVYESRLNEYERILSKGKYGNLSSADYDKLISQADKYRNSLNTHSKKASMDNKITGYKRERDKIELKNKDPKTLQTVFESKYRENANALVGDPEQFVQNVIDAYDQQRQGIEEISSSVDPTDTANYSSLQGEYNKIIQEQAIWKKALESFKSGDKKALEAHFVLDPASGNPIFGEYIPHQLGKVLTLPEKGTESGWKVNGIPVYTKDGMETRKFAGKDSIGDVPATEITPSLFLGKGDLGKGMDNKTLYQNIDGASYAKVLGTSPVNLDSARTARPLPAEWENRINQKVIKVIDSSSLPQPDSLKVAPVSAIQGNLPVNTSPSPEGRQANPQTVIPGTSSSPRSIQQASGQELQQKNTRGITSGNLASKLFSSAKRFFIG